jgi:hypothetical protein
MHTHTYIFPLPLLSQNPADQERYKSLGVCLCDVFVCTRAPCRMKRVWGEEMDISDTGWFVWKEASPAGKDSEDTMAGKRTKGQGQR